MARRSRLKLAPLEKGKETIGRRISRIRQERGFTQAELAKKIGIIQALVSDYERDKLRLHAEMVLRFADALGISTDELLGAKAKFTPIPRISRRLVLRLQQIENLPLPDQRALLRTIDQCIRPTIIKQTT